MLNLLIRDESKFDISVPVGHYPLRVPMSYMDESEFSAKALQEVLAGTKNRKTSPIQATNCLLQTFRTSKGEERAV